jgi:flagellar biosynthesis protein FlhG
MNQAASLQHGTPQQPPPIPTRKQATVSIAVASGKGGVGKTFFTVNMAAAMQKMHKRVLLVDADLGLPNADIALGVTPELTLEDCIFRNLELERAVTETAFGIDLLAANSGARQMVALGNARLSVLVQELIRFASQYDVLLFDCASGINDSVTAFLAASPQSVVVVQPDPTSLVDAYALIKVIHQENLTDNVDIAMNGVRDEKGATRIVERLASVTRAHLGRDLRCLGMVRHTPRAAHAMAARMPLVEFDVSDPAAQQLRAIARHILREKESSAAMNKLNAAGLLKGMLRGGAVLNTRPETETGKPRRR